MNSIINHVDYDFNSTCKIINSLKIRYDFIDVNTIGTSVFGRKIECIKIGKSNEYVLFAGAFHGSERITSTLLLMFVENLCNAIKENRDVAGVNARRALYGRGLLVVPLVNPDGCEISLRGSLGAGQHALRINRLAKGDFVHWNANLRGVDINHNFNAGWSALHEKEQKSGILGPGPTRFGGYKPESEPETVALVNLCRNTKIRHVLAFHSQGEVIYWTFGNKEIPRAKKMAEIMASTTGYSLDIPTPLAEGGGFKDWFISEFGRPGFTVEVGKGENPLAAEKLGDLYTQLKEMMMLSVVM